MERKKGYIKYSHLAVVFCGNSENRVQRFHHRRKDESPSIIRME